MDQSPSRRSELSAKLRLIMNKDNPAQANVYFQPPPNKVLQYPCLVYELEGIQVRRADNGPYSIMDRYQVTFIRQEPDSPVLRELLGLPFSSFSRHFASDNLNHDVFVIYHS